ncbi:hypothetical protein INT48_008801 [Thamnidium elegans]|uniref:Uncharacterized protein n=1 Tax=Thamnidium elegans TaxID=101142 RepID=A0A8H7VWP6_9FUNG|nr:hypothetical protein INT48_008801 [Thamnidium elegans]
MVSTSIMNRAAELHHVEASQTKDDDTSSVDEDTNYNDNYNDSNSINEYTRDNDFTEGLYSIVEKSKESASDQVGSVDILGLSSPTINEAHLTTKAIKRALIEFSYNHDIDPIIHHDAQFIDRTVTIFLDLMASPNNPLRTTYNSTWLERECAATEKSKWNGVLFKVRERHISVALMEFSGGSNDKTSSIKESCDIEKLYTKMLKAIDDTDHIPKAMYCVRFYANVMYFEKLCEYRGAMIRDIVTSFGIPTTPRLVKKYAQQVPAL